MSGLKPNTAAVLSILADTYDPIRPKSPWYCDDLSCNGDPHAGWDEPHCRASQRPPQESWFIWLLLSGRGFGKELALDTPIPTPDGWTTMGEIRRGQIVFDESGAPCTVTQVFNIETPEKSWRLHFSDGTHLDASGEHEWVTWDHSARKSYLRSVGVDHGAMPKSWPTWESNRGMGPRTRTTNEIVASLFQGKRQDRNHSIPVAEPLQSEHSDLPLDPYVLGAWLGDGSTRDGGFTGIDPEIWERIEWAGFAVAHRPDGKNHYIKGLRTVLGRMGLLGNKHVPAQYMRASIDQRTALVQGLMDTDGTISRSGYAEFMSTNRGLSDAILELLRSLGEKPVISEGRATINGKDCGPKWRVTWRPVSVVPVWLQRKRDRLRPLGAQGFRNLHRMITAIEPIDPVPMRCITVDSPNHMYLAGDGMIPTHNSRCAAEWIIKEASENPKTEWGVIGPTSEAVRKCGEDLTAGIYALALPRGVLNETKPYNRTLGDFLFKNGSIIHLISADKPDRLRGFNLAGAWCDEIASWRYPDTWYLGLLPTLRDKRTTPHIVVTSTPKPTQLLRNLVEEEKSERGTTVITRGSTFENAANLAEEFVEEMRTRYEGTRRGRQELYGELLMDVDGALVTQEMIDDSRLEALPTIRLSRIVVAVDPATTSGEEADETGIVVVARGADGRGYVLADLSCKLSPDGWAKIVADAYDKYGADRVVAEENQGRSLVEAIVRSVHPNISYKGVWASRGKRLRAEPIAALYEQGKVSHVGYFTQLEDQWTTWVPDMKGQKSPDRVDALVHAITELGLVGLQGATFQEQMEATHPPCLNCGTPSIVGTEVCPKCGEKLATEDAAAATPPTVTSWSPWSMGQPNLQPNTHTDKVMDFLRDNGIGRYDKFGSGRFGR